MRSTPSCCKPAQRRVRPLSLLGLGVLLGLSLLQRPVTNRLEAAEPPLTPATATGPTPRTGESGKADAGSLRGELAGGGLAGGEQGAADEPVNEGLLFAAAMERVLIRAIAQAERSVVAIARVPKQEAQAGRAPAVRIPALNGPLDLPGPNAALDPTSPDFVPREYASGVVVDAKGLILTNYHVLGDPRENDYYVWVNRRPFRATDVWAVEEAVAGDPWTDLAVLRIDADDLQPITLGDSETLKKGSVVIALGNPYAIARDGQPSASWGIVSNLQRQAVSSPRNQRGGVVPAESLHEYGTLIHTDARLNQGTSGGALVNLRGEMVGLTTALADLAGQDRSAGFAIPVDATFRRSLELLKQGRQPMFGFLGVAPQHLSFAQRQQGRRGAEVMDVVAGTPAQQAGLAEGDVITHVNQRSVADRTELFRDLSRLPAGSQVLLTIRRGERTEQRQVRLAKKYTELAGPGFSREEPFRWRGVRVDYATAMPPQFATRATEVNAAECVAVIDVAENSAAWQAGLRAGDYLARVAGRRVRSPDDFRQAVADQEGPVRVRLADRGEDAVEYVVAP